MTNSTHPSRVAVRWDVSTIVRELRAARQAFDGERKHALGQTPLPSRDALVRIAGGLRAALFPAHFGPGELGEEGVDFFVGHTLERTLRDLHEQIRRGLGFDCDRGLACVDCDERAAEATRAYAAQLPAIRAMLESDVRAAYDGDPAATNTDEVVFSYPGVTAITHHRLAHPLYLLAVPLIPRMLAEIAHADTGIDIHPGAEIGEGFFIDHGTGVVIGETCRIGKRVRLYQGVTLGAKSFPLDESGRPIKGVPRHPIVEDDVIVYSGATILGRITIGASSSIGGNVWLTRSAPAFSRVTQAQVRSDVFEGGGGI
jgi:serine O-acetyltransferase